MHNRTPLATLTLAIHLGLAGTLGSLPALAASSQYHYDIPACTLGQALNQFAQQAGVALIFEASQVSGLQSPGLQGEFSVAEGFATLLQGSGYQAVAGAGGYRLMTTPKSASGVELGATSISGKLLNDATEGTGSYTTGPMQTATKLPLSIRETPQSVSVITRQQIEDQHLADIGSVLDRSVGITQNKYESDRGDITARGFTITKMQFDGMPSTSMGNSFGSDLMSDTAIYDHVEIVRGATGLLTGRGEPSAAINLVRKRPTSEVQGYTQFSAGSWDTYRNETDISGPLTEGKNLRGRVVGTYTDGDSFMENYGKDVGVLYGILESDLADDLLFTLGVDYQKSHVDGATWYPPTPVFYADGSRYRSRSTSSGADWAFIDTKKLTGFTSIEKSFSNNWKAKLQYTHRDSDADVKHMALYGFPDRLTGAGVSVDYQATTSENRQDAVDLNAAGPFSLLGQEHELVLGYSYFSGKTDTRWNYRTYGNPLESFYDRHDFPEPFSGTGASKLATEQHEEAFYLASRWHLADPLKLIVGARLSNTEQDVTERGTTTSSRYSDELTPYAGLVYDFAEHYSAYLSYTDIFQTQTVRNRSGALLDPIVGTNYEAGIKGEFYNRRLNLTAAIFKVEQDNVAEFDAIVEGEARYKPADGITVRGYELEASGEPTPGWNISGGFTRRLVDNGTGSYAETTQPQNLLRLTSAHQLTGMLSAFTVGGHVTWQSEIYEKGRGPRGLDSVQDSYGLVHLFGTYKATDEFSFQANLNNIFDKSYYAGFLDGYGRYGDPRNINVSMKYTF